MTEDETVGWHHQLDRHEFEQVLRVGDGQGSLVCCSPWDHKESDTAERLKWTDWIIPNKSIDDGITEVEHIKNSNEKWLQLNLQKIPPRVVWVEKNFTQHNEDKRREFSSVAHCVRLLVTPRTAARQASLSIASSRSLLKLKGGRDSQWWTEESQMVPNQS